MVQRCDPCQCQAETHVRTCQEPKDRAMGSHPIVWLHLVLHLDSVTRLSSHTGTAQDLHPPPALTTHLLTKMTFTAVLLEGSDMGASLTWSMPKCSCSISLIVHWFWQVSLLTWESAFIAVLAEDAEKKKKLYSLLQVREFQSFLFSLNKYAYRMKTVFDGKNSKGAAFFFGE